MEHTNLNVIDRMYVFHRIQNNFSNLYLIEKKTNRRLSIYFLVWSIRIQGTLSFFKMNQRKSSPSLPKQNKTKTDRLKKLTHTQTTGRHSTSQVSSAILSGFQDTSVWPPSTTFLLPWMLGCSLLLTSIPSLHNY